MSEAWHKMLVDGLSSGFPSDELINYMDEILAWFSRLGEGGGVLEAKLVAEYGDLGTVRRNVIVMLDRLLFVTPTSDRTLFGRRALRDQEELKRRYGRLMRIFHPDRGYHDPAWLTARSEIINTRYRALQKTVGRADSTYTNGDQREASINAAVMHQAKSSAKPPREKSDAQLAFLAALRKHLPESPQKLQRMVLGGLVVVAVVVVGLVYQRNRSFDYQESGIGDQGSVVGNQGSGIGDQGAGVGDQGSGTGNQESVAVGQEIGNREEGIGNSDLDSTIETEQLADVEAARIEAEEVATSQAKAAPMEAERVAAEEAARLDSEKMAAANAEATRMEAERLATAKAEEEAARIEAEKAAALAEAERVAAEQHRAEEATRVEANRVEAERVAALAEAERIAAEKMKADEAARMEEERLAAERAEAARLEAEYLAAEAAARQEAERVAATEAEKARVEAERLAALEAARKEAERVAAEEAEQLAATEAARLAAEADAVKQRQELVRFQVMTLMEGMRKAYDAGDADAYAAFFSVDGSDSDMRGRDEINRRYEAFFSSTASRSWRAEIHNVGFDNPAEPEVTGILHVQLEQGRRKSFSQAYTFALSVEKVDDTLQVTSFDYEER